MEITKKARFITDVYGGAPLIGAQGILERYIEQQIDKSLISFLDGIKKKGETIQSKAEEILKIFHRDQDNNPAPGNWMIKRCLVKTGQSIFNAMKDRTHPKRDIIDNAIIQVDPIPFVYFRDNNGFLIPVPQGVRTYTVSLKNRSFFTAYEYLPMGTEFCFTVTYDDSLLKSEHMELILEKAGRFGVGAFRERYGKFVLVA